MLKHEYAVPLRLLGVGLPLTIVAGAVAGGGDLRALSTAEAIVLAILLAPTDAALGEAVVTEPRLPSRVRQGLNVESGLNDGICVPLLLIVLAAAEVETTPPLGHHAISIVAEEIGYGIVGGVGAGLLAAAVVVRRLRRGLVTASWLQVIPVAGAALAYGIAVALGGSGFIAAFVGGAIFGAIAAAESDEAVPAQRGGRSAFSAVSPSSCSARFCWGRRSSTSPGRIVLLRRAQPDRRADAAGRDRDARDLGELATRWRSWAGLAREASRRSCSR